MREIQRLSRLIVLADVAVEVGAGQRDDEREIRASLGEAGAGLAMSAATACAVVGRTAVGVLLPADADRRAAGALNFLLQAAGSAALAAAGGGALVGRQIVSATRAAEDKALANPDAKAAAAPAAPAGGR